MAEADFIEQRWPAMAIALPLPLASGLVDSTGYLGVAAVMALQAIASVILAISGWIGGQIGHHVAW